MKEAAIQMLRDKKHIVAMWTEKDKLIVGTDVPMKYTYPSYIGGLPAEYRKVGKIEALQSRTDKWRPAPGGVSIGHYAITAGTLGGIVKDIFGNRVILSNNHVLANSNNGNKGDDILQPGPHDLNGGNGGNGNLCPWANAYAGFGNFCAQVLGRKHRVKAYVPQQEDYVIAHLEDFVGIIFDETTPNLVDAAIARPISDDVVLDEILEIGVPTGMKQAVLGMEVRKSGRTSGVNHGTVQGIDGVVKVSYSSGYLALFEDQIITTFMAEGGDSGSWLMDENSLNVTGLLFAGSDTISIHNHIGNVFSELGLTL